ncbi:hypothetical protein D3C81_630210 [compost metagenome]
MPYREHRARDHFAQLAVGLVLALALFVLHHAALLVQGLLVDGTQQVTHAVGLHPQRHVQRGGRHVLEIVGAVGVRGAIHVGGTSRFKRGEVLPRRVLAAVEHQVLEQVGEATATRRLVLAAHVVPEVHRHDRCLAVGVHQHAQAVGQGELIVGNVDRRRCGGGLGLGLGRQRCADESAEGSTESQGQKSGAGCCFHSTFLGHECECRS